MLVTTGRLTRHRWVLTGVLARLVLTRTSTLLSEVNGEHRNVLRHVSKCVVKSVLGRSPHTRFLSFVLVRGATSYHRLTPEMPGIDNHPIDASRVHPDEA